MAQKLLSRKKKIMSRSFLNSGTLIVIIFEMLKKKIWVNFQRILELLTKTIVTKLSKIWVWDPGSGKKTIPDPGVKKALDPGSATLFLRYRYPVFRIRSFGSGSWDLDPWICNLSGSLTRDFRLQVFFINQCSPGPRVCQDCLEFFQNSQR